MLKTKKTMCQLSKLKNFTQRGKCFPTTKYGKKETNIFFLVVIRLFTHYLSGSLQTFFSLFSRRTVAVQG